MDMIKYKYYSDICFNTVFQSIYLHNIQILFTTIHKFNYLLFELIKFKTNKYSIFTQI